MNFYEERILPHIVNRACGSKAAHHLRERACEGLHGNVVEIGFGSAHNVPFYPEAVSSVTAIEPSDRGWELGEERVAAATVPIERAGLDGEQLPMADASCDTALSTWTMCTIPDIDAALQEIRRVLKPGGTLHFIEHGLAPDESVRRWQHRLEPIQKRVGGGCHLTRPIVQLLTDAGFEVGEVDEFYESKMLKPLSADSLGVAVSP